MHYVADPIGEEELLRLEAAADRGAVLISAPDVRDLVSEIRRLQTKEHTAAMLRHRIIEFLDEAVDEVDTIDCARRALETVLDAVKQLLGSGGPAPQTLHVLVVAWEAERGSGVPLVSGEEGVDESVWLFRSEEEAVVRYDAIASEAESQGERVLIRRYAVDVTPPMA